MTPEQAFDALVRGDSSRPFVTYYDEASGERSELSVRSLANWVAKTHHMLADELGLGVGDTALVDVGAHWISYPVLLGCLTAGLSLTDADAEAADVAFVEPPRLAAAAGVPDVYAIAPDSAAVGFRGAPPDGAGDYVAAVRPQADAWAGVHLAASDDDPFTARSSRAGALAAAADLAAARGLERGARILVTREWHGSDDWTLALLVPLALGGSVVLVRNADDETVARRAGQERATVVD